ncbi:hypothetical protein [Microbulbifer celer]|uniref:Uncharacterized protein n=1 Tax=Microbulbifer celer TaxID=435905 RepID=A0ABW3UAJ4_9GAMM|nr:hypothetical protein [Microbulbifer celer]UFN58579.1 hypothetical protein LPW13_05920 [Microbulbifer celer]
MSEYSTEDLLSDKEIPAAEPETPETPTEPTGEEPEPEKPTGEEPEKPEGDDPKKDDSTPEPEKPSDPPEDEEPKDWTFKAVKDERTKRQAAEARAKELEEKLQQFIGGQQQQPEQPKKPDWFNDPETAAQQQQQQMQQMLFEQRAQIGQEIMRDQHDDFDEMETRFFQMLEENPQLGAGLHSAANPAKYAYETAKKAMEAEALKDVDGYKARLREEVRKEEEAKVRAEYEAKLQKQQEKEGAILPSLSDAPSRGGLKSDDWSGPTPLDEILK